MIEDWVFADNLQPLLSVLTQVCGGKFDEDDWIAVAHGLTQTDAKHQRWFDYLVSGAACAVRFEVAHDPGTSVVWIRVHEPQAADGFKTLFTIGQTCRVRSGSRNEAMGEQNADWKSVDNQWDLDHLNQQICWDDSSTIEYYGTCTPEPYFPSDTAGSTLWNRNIHVLCEVDSQTAPYLEVVLIGCDWFYYSSLEHLHFSGHVDNRKRVEISDGKGSTLLRCARLIYRFLSRKEITLPYFRNAGSVSSAVMGLGIRNPPP